MDFMKWLYPGLGIKRWLVLGVLGFILISVGMAIISETSILGLLEVQLSTWVKAVFDGYLLVGGALVLGLGVILMIISFKEVVRAFIKAAFPEFARTQVRPIHQQRVLRRGPKIVVLGGGTGLSVLLRGLKEYSNNITAVVSVADDGGSSGRLRNQLGILPPGDIRNCMVALADKEALMEKLFNYRFKQGEELAGHNLGNLFLAAMNDMYGNFEEAVGQMSKVLAIRGKVLPSTLEEVVLKAELSDGSTVVGESNISKTTIPITKISIDPASVRPQAEVLQVIEEADAIILGPGSLYTSVIPNLLVSGITEAIKKSKGLKIYVCNVMTQPGETEGYTAGEHLESIYKHSNYDLIDYILVNNQPISNRDLLEKYILDGAEQVEIDHELLAHLNVKVVARPLLDETKLVRHDPLALASTIIDLILSHKKFQANSTFIDRFILQEKSRARNEGK